MISKKNKIKYYLLVLGCQMNESDAERIRAVLELEKCQETTVEQEADIIIVIACSVRQSAIDRIYGKIRVWQKIKKTKKLTTILTGCVLPSDKKKLVSFFDHVLDITAIGQLPQLLWQKPINRQSANEYLEIEPLLSSDFQVFVPIMTGCNNFCTYCAVPHTRGREKSRSSKKIIREVKKYIQQGYKEITLLGQNVNSYGLDHKNEINFVQLLKKIDLLKGDFWLRFMTSHPKDLSLDLIQFIGSSKHLCPNLHLPIQSGDDQILKKMNRQYTVKSYLNLIKQVRLSNPDISISTDTIVGFPGETKKQFQNTVKTYKLAQFDMAYIARYSPRPNTVAMLWPDNISKAEKRARELKLSALVAKTAIKFNSKFIGQEIKVLIKGIKKIKGQQYKLIGKSAHDKTVKTVGPKKLLGQFVYVEISEVTPYGLNGKLKAI